MTPEIEDITSVQTNTFKSHPQERKIHKPMEVTEMATSTEEVRHPQKRMTHPASLLHRPPLRLLHPPVPI